MIYEGTIAKAWEYTLGGGSVVTCFTIDGVPDHAFIGDTHWMPVMAEAMDLGTRCRVMASELEIAKCADPMCGDGCCDDPDCTNVPEEERRDSFVLRADTVEWF